MPTPTSRERLHASSSTGKKHAASWPGSSSRSSGSSASQRLCRNRQRGANGHDVGASSMLRGCPAIGFSAASAPRVEPRHALEQPERVRMARLAEDLVGRPALDERARVHHLDPLADPGDDAEVVGDHDQRGVALGRRARAADRGSAPGSSRRARSSARRRSAASARRPAPSRSSRAGASRPRTGADSP